MKKIPEFSSADQSRIIEMAWEDRTPFEAIATLYGLSQSDLDACMRSWIAPSSFRLWRQRMRVRVTKHHSLRDPAVQRAYCKTQYKR